MRTALQTAAKPQAFTRAQGASRLRSKTMATAAPVAAPMTAAAPAVKERAKAAILGGLLADAASMPLHWIYDVPKMQELLAAKGLTAAAPEFYPEPSCPFYQHPFGSLSPYGHELIPLLRTLADEGKVDEDKYAQAIHRYFASEEPNAYRNKSIRNVVAAVEEGKKGRECGDAADFQANCFAKASLLVALYAGTPQLRSAMESAIRVQQNNDQAVAFGIAGALLLEKVVLGSSIEEALAWASSEGGLDAELRELVQRGLSSRTTPLRELTYEPSSYMVDMVSKHMALKDALPAFTTAVWCNGPACGNPAAFANVAMAAAHYGTAADAYVAGVRANLMAGGDNCSRSLLIGALLAAQGGVASLPADWRSKVPKMPEYEALVDRLLARA